jgi:hypothetical protein
LLSASKTTLRLYPTFAVTAKVVKVQGAVVVVVASPGKAESLRVIGSVLNLSPEATKIEELNLSSKAFRDQRNEFVPI